MRISQTDKSHVDAWELGTGINYSINEVLDIFKERFGNVDKVNIPDQTGNYRETLRENNDTLDLLGWSPKDKLKEYILSL